MSKFVKSAAVRTAVYYTVAIMIFCFAVIFTNGNDDSLSLDPARVLCFFPFCVCLAVANTAMKYKEVEALTRWLLHASLTIIGAFVFLILPVEFNQSSAKFMGLIIICAVYAVGALIYAMFSVRVKKAISEDEKLKNKSRRK